MSLIAVFAGLVLLRYAAVLFLAALIIRPVRSCPACGANVTVPVQQPWIRLLARTYEWRWCPSCGWQALARRESARGKMD